MAEDIYLIRHGQSTFNLHFEATGIDPLHFDAPLSALGLKQVAELRAQAAELNVDLVVTSPLTRALETAVGLFGGDSVPIVVSSLHRERLGNSCDVGTAPEILSAAFPMLEFDHLDDTWWHEGEKDSRGVPIEPDSVFSDRVTAFSQWAVSRPESTLAVVGHGTFIHRLTGRHLENCEILKWNP